MTWHKVIDHDTYYTGELVAGRIGRYRYVFEVDYCYSDRLIPIAGSVLRSDPEFPTVWALDTGKLWFDIEQCRKVTEEFTSMRQIYEDTPTV